MDIHSKENVVQLLSASAFTLRNSAQSNILKSYYLTQCRIMTLGGPVSLPLRFTKRTVRCPHCCVEYSDGSASYQIKTIRKQNRFVRRLLKKTENGNNNITSFQKVYLKNLKKKGDLNSHNNLIINCGVCKHRIIEKLNKPKKESDAVVEQNPVQTLSKSQKRKRKKDKFFGLNKDVVLALTPQNKRANNPALIETPILKTSSEKIGMFKNKPNRIVSNKSKVVPKKELQASQKKLKGLQNILSDSKKKKAPSVTLKQFLNSI